MSCWSDCCPDCCNDPCCTTISLNFKCGTPAQNYVGDINEGCSDCCCTDPPGSGYWSTDNGDSFNPTCCAYIEFVVAYPSDWQICLDGVDVSGQNVTFKIPLYVNGIFSGAEWYTYNGCNISGGVADREASIGNFDWGGFNWYTPPLSSSYSDYIYIQGNLDLYIELPYGPDCCPDSLSYSVGEYEGGVTLVSVELKEASAFPTGITIENGLPFGYDYYLCKESPLGHCCPDYGEYGAIWDKWSCEGAYGIYGAGYFSWFPDTEGFECPVCPECTACCIVINDRDTCSGGSEGTDPIESWGDTPLSIFLGPYCQANYLGSFGGWWTHSELGLGGITQLICVSGPYCKNGIWYIEVYAWARKSQDTLGHTVDSTRWKSYIYTISADESGCISASSTLTEFNYSCGHGSYEDLPAEEDVPSVDNITFNCSVPFAPKIPLPEGPSEVEKSSSPQKFIKNLPNFDKNIIENEEFVWALTDCTTPCAEHVVELTTTSCFYIDEHNNIYHQGTGDVTATLISPLTGDCGDGILTLNAVSSVPPATFVTTTIANNILIEIALEPSSTTCCDCNLCSVGSCSTYSLSFFDKSTNKLHLKKKNLLNRIAKSKRR